MEGLIQQICSGLSNGIIYGSLALALVMIYKATSHINFAQGEMATFSTFFAWWLMSIGWTYWMSFSVTLVVSFAGGFLIQWVVLRPIERAPITTNVIVLIGLMLIFNALSGWIFGSVIKAFPSPFPTNMWIASVFFSAHQIGSAIVLVAMLGTLFLFFQFTSIGLTLRAAAQNANSARLVGINVSLMLAIGWGMAAVIGAVAGILIAPIVFLDPNMMSGIMLYGFAAALIGGIDNPAGAVVGGLIVGVLENLLGVYVFGEDLKLTVALFVLVATLMIRPNGLLGKKLVVRV